MSHSFLKIWALVATVIALVLFGFVIGRQSQTAAPLPQTVERIAQTTSTTSSDSSQAEPPNLYVVPQDFIGVKTNWRTPVNDRSLEGYAVSFDPERREVILESCKHPGYFNVDLGQPVNSTGDFCTLVLWGTLTEFRKNGAVATDRKGDSRELALRLDKDGDNSTLNIEFLDHKLNLVPGSKNDFFQQIEQSEAIREQKRLLFSYEQDKLKDRLQTRQEESLER